MNIKRFTARTSREALALVRQALGDDAVVLSTRPSADGVEVLALPGDGMDRIEQAAARSAPARPAPPPAAPVLISAPTPPRAASLAERIAARGERLLSRAEPRHPPRLDPHDDVTAAPRFAPPPRHAAPPRTDTGHDAGVAADVQALGMSTLTFQDYVRERMLKRRQAELPQAGDSVPAALRAGTAPQRAASAASMSSPGAGLAEPPPAMHAALHAAAQQRPGAGQAAAGRAVVAPPQAAASPVRPPAALPRLGDEDLQPAERYSPPLPEPAARSRSAAPRRNPPLLLDRVHFDGSRPFDGLDDGPAAATPLQDSQQLMGELRSVRELIEERFGMLAFMERMQRDPRQVALSQALFDTGLSPALVRKLVQSLPADVADGMAWAATVLERNVLTGEHEAPLEEHDGVFALIGPTGVGKTTSTAKLAAAFATRHGAAQLGLITLDAYRVAAHEQLRTYGRILGVPVHTAHDRASLEDLLDLLSAKKLVLIDTAGMAQRDSRTRELLEMLAHRQIRKLLVVNAAAQGETVDDVLSGYGVAQCHGVIVSKLDEAVKLGPALDALIRHKARIVGVANGQRVPEDWHRLSAQALVQRALRGGGSASWRLDTHEVNLMFAATQGAGYPGAVLAGAGFTPPLHA